ncbi:MULTISPECIES: MFS transporter [Serratia]|nr:MULTISPECIES: MFS transporter [Serratia]RYM64298.1 hypothetical protein BSR03_04365 [Serratia proteamaculans]
MTEANNQASSLTIREGRMLSRNCCALYMVNSFAYFMAWPLLTILLVKQYGMTHLAVGTLFTAALLLNATVALFSSVIIRGVGARNSIFSGLVLQCIGFIIIGLANVPMWVIIGLLVISTGRGVFESPMKTYLSDNILDKGMLFKTFQLAYLFVNAGAACGPLFSMTIGLKNVNVNFLVAGVVFLAMAIFVILFFNNNKVIHPEGKVVREYKQAIKNKIFLCLLVSEIVLAYVFIHYDTTFYQYITALSLKNPTEIISFTVMIKSVVVIVTQAIFVSLLSLISKAKRVYIGSACFVISGSLIGFAAPLAGEHFDLLFYCAVVFVGIGEAVLFPLSAILVDRIAPEGAKGTYYALTNLYLLGFAAGPIVGGWALTQGGMMIFWLLDAVFVLLAAGLLLAAIRHTSATRFSDSNDVQCYSACAQKEAD